MTERSGSDTERWQSMLQGVELFLHHTHLSVQVLVCLNSTVVTIPYRYTQHTDLD